MDGKRSSAESEEQSKQKRKAETVPFRKLFAFADCADITLMVVGSVGAIGNGLGFPLMTLLFGEIIDAFGANQNSPGIVEKVSQVRTNFSIICYRNKIKCYKINLSKSNYNIGLFMFLE